MAQLFQALNLKNHTLKNRIIVSPMCQYSAIDGFANNWHLVHYGQFASGGAAAIIQEATAVSPEGRISFADLGLWKDEHVEKLKEITDFIRSQNCIPGIQLAHAGRKASENIPWLGRKQFSPEEENGWQTVSASAIPFHSTNFIPTALSITEITNVIQQFRSAAKRAVQAGYEIIEIHAAHGYLIHQFYSPLINRRTDEYGGSFENRIRLLEEIIKAVKEELSTQSLWVRISATDWAENGWDLEASTQLAKHLSALNVEVLDVSTGGGVYEQQIDAVPNFQVPFAHHLKRNSPLKIGTVGLIKTGQQAEEILQQQQADLIFIGREFLKNPHFVYTAAEALNVDIEWAKQYERAK